MPIVASGEFLTLDEAAARSGTSRATLQNWVRTGRLPGKKWLSDGDWSPTEKWHILDRDLEAVLGRRLRPTIFEHGQELEGVEKLLTAALAALGDPADVESARRDLRFATQVVTDLRAAVQG
jgi:hypothetical protein